MVRFILKIITNYKKIQTIIIIKLYLPRREFATLRNNLHNNINNNGNGNNNNKDNNNNGNIPVIFYFKNNNCNKATKNPHKFNNNTNNKNNNSINACPNNFLYHMIKFFHFHD